MAANSAVRAGSGLVTLAVPNAVNTILEMKTTEPMTLPLPDRGLGHLVQEALTPLLEAAADKDAVACGPGISRDPEAAAVVRELCRRINLPFVVDADGLNAIADDPEVLSHIQSPSFVITPHPGEMARLTGLSVAEVEGDRLNVASRLAVNHCIYVILKGARTVVASPDGLLAINGSGNPGMASGGMGDVLTGVVVSLLGQGYNPWDACRLGVYLHGKAADLVAVHKGEIGLSACDVQDSIPYAYQTLQQV
jgi:NAD(P)H-hydrate epimerase